MTLNRRHCRLLPVRRRRRSARLLPLIVAAMLAAGSQPAAGASPDLAARIDAVTQTPGLRNALWGVRVEDEDGTLLFDRNGVTLMLTGSTRKLFTAAAVLSCYGLGERLQTVVSLTGSSRGAEHNGDLVIHGAGDPSLGGRYVGDDRSLAFAPVIRALRQRGIQRITGSVVADVSSFERSLIPPSWKFDNVGTDYGQPVDALAFNENVTGVFVTTEGCDSYRVDTDPHFLETETSLSCGPEAITLDSVGANEIHIHGTYDPALSGREPGLVAIERPGLYTAQGLHDQLERSGIRVSRPPRETEVPLQVALTRLTTLESPPFALMLSTVLKNSPNLYAEMLFKLISPPPHSYAGAFAAERDFLTRVVGVHSDEFAFDDGSGLSPENVVTPRATIQVLRFLSRWRPEVAELLVRPRESGTLSRRLRDVAQPIRGKTGEIHGVNALVGWVELASGRKRFFTVFVNHHTRPGSEATAAIDQIVRVIAED